MTFSANFDNTKTGAGFRPAPQKHKAMTKEYTQKNVLRTEALYTLLDIMRCNDLDSSSWGMCHDTDTHRFGDTEPVQLKGKYIYVYRPQMHSDRPISYVGIYVTPTYTVRTPYRTLDLYRIG